MEDLELCFQGTPGRVCFLFTRYCIRAQSRVSSAYQLFSPRPCLQVLHVKRTQILLDQQTGKRFDHRPTPEMNVCRVSRVFSKRTLLMSSAFPRFFSVTNGNGRLQSSKVLTGGSMNPFIKQIEYAVRGAIVIRASEIEKELEQVNMNLQIRA